MQINRLNGWIIIILSLIYCRVETNFFGNHFTPSCAEEVLADGIGLLIACIGLAVLSFKNKSS